MSMRLSNLVTGLVMFSLIFTGLIVFLSDLTTNYGVTISDEFQSTYDSFNTTLETMQDTSEDFKNTIENGTGSGGSSGGSGALGFVDSFFSIGWNTIKTLTSTYQIAGQMIVASANIPGLDTNADWLTTGLITVIILAITMLLLGVLMRRPF